MKYEFEGVDVSVAVQVLEPQTGDVPGHVVPEKTSQNAGIVVAVYAAVITIVGDVGKVIEFPEAAEQSYTVMLKVTLVYTVL